MRREQKRLLVIVGLLLALVVLTSFNLGLIVGRLWP